MDLAFENQFWLRIANDHLHFIQDNLAPTEVDYLERVFELHEIAHNLLLNAVNANVQEILSFMNLTMNLKRDIIEEQTRGEIKIGLPPTFLAHMLNEEEEYLCILLPETCSEMRQISPLMSTHKLWLTDVVGHLDAIYCELDSVEGMLRKRAHKQKKKFKKLQQKALEFISYLKHKLPEFPAMAELNTESVDLTLLYLNFLRELHHLREEKLALGTLDPDLLDHMFREQSYYLLKLGYNLPREYAIEGITALSEA